MFSKRLNYPFYENELSELLKKVELGRVLNFIESNPTKVSLPYPEELTAVFVDRENLFYNPDPKGLKKAREVILKYYQDRKLSIDIKQIYISSGTSEAYSYIFKLLCDPEDNILIPNPGYPLFDYLASLECIRTKPYRLEYVHGRGWFIDFDDIKRNIDGFTKAIVVINPNNPTGSYVRHEEKEKLVEIAKRYNISLISDEVFYDFKLNRGSFPSFASESRVLCFTLSGISKILGLPQMKLSWIIVNGPESYKEEACEKLEVISDTFLSVSIPVQNGLEKLFSCCKVVTESIKFRIKQNYEFIKSALAKTPLRVLDTEGGWNAIIELPRVISEREWVEKLLLEKNTLVYPGYFFDFEKEAYIVVSLIVEGKKTEKGIENILSLYEKYA